MGRLEEEKRKAAVAQPDDDEDADTDYEYYSYSGSGSAYGSYYYDSAEANVGEYGVKFSNSHNTSTLSRHVIIFLFGALASFVAYGIYKCYRKNILKSPSSHYVHFVENEI